LNEKRETRNETDKRNHYSEQFCDRGINSSSDLALDRLYQYLTFTLYCRSNNLTYQAPYSKRQFIVLGLIKELQKQGLGYRKIAQKFNSWGIKTDRGNAFISASIHSIIKRYGQRVFRIDAVRNKKYPSKLSSMNIIFDE